MSPTNEGGRGSRGRRQEEAHFAGIEREQAERRRAENERLEARRSLGREAGLDDESVDVLFDVGIRAETLPALDWIPLVEVAWSDGDVDGSEKEVLLAATEEDSIVPDHPAHRLLQSWIEQRPGPALLDAWKLHVSVAGRTPEQRKQVLDRVDRVARASGGLLGIGKVSGAESEVLVMLEAVLG